MPIFYYQVIGWRSHVTRLPGSLIPRPTDEIAEILWHYLAEDGLLTLTLGILPCGASYLLTPATPEMDRELRELFTGRAHPATRFISLSPLEFRDRDTLRAKLDRHQQKSKKNKRNEPDRDLSQANTHYTTGRPYDVLTQEGHDRVIFEYHRLFYRLCRASIDSTEYSIKRVPFFDNIRAYSLAYTVHKPSTWRPLEQRKREPVVLDLGFAEWILPASSIDMTAESGEYFTMKETSRLKNPGLTQGTYMYGDAQSVTREELQEKLSQKFTRNLNAPILLFVQDGDEAVDVLRFYGVDASDWTTAFEPVIGKDALEIGDRLPKDDPVKPESGRGRFDDRYGDEDRKRSDRSRSPKRGTHASRPRSPPRGNKHAVYVVDVTRLYATMRRMPRQDLSITQMADDLDVKLEPSESGVQHAAGQWCGGNECRLVAFIWRALASGSAIDEQLLRLQSRPPRSAPAPVQPTGQVPAALGDWDDDADPNDVVAAAPAARQVASNPYDEFEDDDFEED